MTDMARLPVEMRSARPQRMWNNQSIDDIATMIREIAQSELGFVLDGPPGTGEKEAESSDDTEWYIGVNDKRRSIENEQLSRENQDLAGSGTPDLTSPEDYVFVDEDDMGDEVGAGIEFEIQINNYLHSGGLRLFLDALRKDRAFPLSEMENPTSFPEYLTAIHVSLDGAGGAAAELAKDSTPLKPVPTMTNEQPVHWIKYFTPVEEHLDGLEESASEVAEDSTRSEPVPVMTNEQLLRWIESFTPVEEHLHEAEGAATEVVEDSNPLDPVSFTAAKEHLWPIEFADGKTDITFVPDYHSTFVNNAQGWIEHFLHEPINWWPLSP